MNKLIKVSVAMLMAIGVSTAVYAATAKQAASRLYVIHANKGSISKAQGNYQLTLHKPKISYFTDRPVRAAGRVSITKFVSDWSKGQNSFAKDNPNAALIAGFDGLNQNADSENFVVLTNPKYSATTMTLTLGVKPFRAVDALRTGNFKDIVLFVDNDCMQDPTAPGCW